MNRDRFFPVAALALLAALFWAPVKAYGQGSTWAGANLVQMIESAGWRLGALRINAALQIMNAGYDSDVYFGYRSEPVPDLTFSASVPVQILLPLSKKIVIDVSDSPQYDFYLKTESWRSWNNTFAGRVHLAFDRVYLQAGGDLDNSRRRLSSELELNVRQKRNSLNGLALWQVSKGLALSALFGTEEYEYEDPESVETDLAEKMNRKEDRLGVIAYILPSPRIRFFLNGRYGTHTFASESSDFRDARSYGVFGGLEFVPRTGEIVQGAGVQGSLRLGYERFDLKDPRFLDGSGITGEADISARLMHKTTGRIFFSRGFNYSIYFGSTYYLQTSYGAGLSRLLSRRATLSYDISYGQSDYPEDFSDAADPFGTLRNRYLSHTASLRFRAARDLDVTFLGRLSSRIRTAGGEARERGFIGFSLTYGFAQGRS
jgi:hypothetical protein